MARKLKKKNFRIAVSGISAGMTGAHAEYVVENGDLAEEPQRMDFGVPDPNMSIGDYWQQATAEVKRVEKL